MFATVAVLIVICVIGAAMVIAREPSDTRPVAEAQVETPAVEEPKASDDVKLPPPARTMTAAGAATRAKTADEQPANEQPANEQAPVTKTPVTITGCLDRDGSGFRLTHTSGASAPKARSWKSGFLRKSPASIDVVDVAKTQHFATYVGQRVSVTGMLDDREMRAQSVWRVAGSCN